jgi:release factor glutamine methyltransferase
MTVPRRPAEVLRSATDYLARHGVQSPRETAETLLMSVLETDRAGLYARREGLDQPTARRFAQALCGRCRGTPLQWLIGEQQFRGLTVRVGPDVLVPRPETEVLVDAVLEVLAQEHAPVVVDVGTGSGAVALAVKQERPDARVVATERSEPAAEVARGNASRLALDVGVFTGDLLSPLPRDLAGAVDAVVSNPPYLTEKEFDDLPAEVKAEPYAALVGGTEVHARLVSESPAWLAGDGWLIVEIGAGQADEVIGLFEAGGFTDVEVRPDLAGRDRMVRGRRTGP